jgi:hypothetical protein
MVGFTLLLFHLQIKRLLIGGWVDLSPSRVCGKEKILALLETEPGHRMRS